MDFLLLEKAIQVGELTKGDIFMDAAIEVNGVRDTMKLNR